MFPDFPDAGHTWSLLHLVSQFNKLHHFVVDIFRREHPEMMVKLVHVAGNLRYFSEAQVVGMRFGKRKDDMHKILSQLGDPGYATMPVGYAHNCFSRM